ncbi:hypothetical protein QE152_g16040 [Popillia japonica]|uniref:Uncharacterized protein n=1 Tax=Popillia japonica TaxID=7064 RepID=A0AAW1L3M7_POPJA
MGATDEMVRNYKRKTKKGAGTVYSSEDLDKALDDIKNGNRKTEKGAGTVYSSEDLDKALDDIKNGNKTTRGAAFF